MNNQNYRTFTKNMTESNELYEKKIKAPNFVNYMDKTIKYYHKPRLFANDDFLNKTEEDKPIPNILEGWSFISKDEII